MNGTTIVAVLPAHIEKKDDCINFLSEEEVPWTLDGEYGGNPREVTIRNLQQALEIMVKNISKMSN